MDERNSPVSVKGSTIDMLNLTDMIYQYGDLIDRVVVTLDQHPYNHIAHAEMWIDRNNRNPKPFQQIVYTDIVSGRWRAVIETNQQVQANYVRDAETAGYSLTIWPRHCIIGSLGAAMCQRLSSDLYIWAKPTRLVHTYNKSGNWSTEHISSFKTVVPRYDDGTTWFNNYLYSAIQADTILIAGEALSHGVKETVMDAIEYSYNADLASRMVILEDCTSPREGYRVQADEFLHEFCRRGGRVVRSEVMYRDTITC